MDAKIINPFLMSAINMFKEMFNFTPENGKPYLVEGFANHRWDISGVIGIVGSTEGVIVIRLTRSMAFRLLIESGLKTDDAEETNSMINGMVGEFANIISGNALNMISSKKVDVTVPITIQGTNHTISWPNKGPIVGIPFYTPFGPFEIQVNLSSNPTFGI